MSDFSRAESLNQTYNNVEYIIIDGGSTDGTVEIIESFSNDISYFISEKDNGIYDAINKGIKLAKGDVIGLLNSDDYYPDNSILSSVSIAEWFLYPHSYEDKIQCLTPFFFDEV